MSKVPFIQENKLEKPNVRVKKQKGWGHWNSFLKSKEYEDMVPGQIDITLEELSKHNKHDDLWIGLMHDQRIRVFDVTKFAEYHPGGYEILANVAGKDATEEFRLAHAYVSAHMIAKFQLGFLVRSSFKSPNSLSPGMVMMPPVRRPPPKLKPRWDWNENGEMIRLKIELIKPLLQANDNISVQFIKDLLKIRCFMEHEYYYFEIKLHNWLTPLLDTIQYNQENKEVTLNIHTTKAGFGNLGAVTLDRVMSLTESLDKEEFLPCTISHIRDLNKDCREIILEWPKSIRIGIPLGHHVLLKATIDGQIILRPYTPVCTITPTSTKTNNTSSIILMIKRYSDGILSSHIHTLDQDSIIDVSLPLGQFRTPMWVNDDISSGIKLTSLTATPIQQSKDLVLLAAGSGITPMIRIINLCLSISCSRIILLFFNRKESDLIYQDEFDALRQHYKDKFQFHNILSQPDPKWDGYKGRISEELLKQILRDKFDKRTYLICGPNGFNATGVEIFRKWNISNNNFWEFKG